MVTGFEVLGALSASYNFTKDIVAFFKAVYDAKTDIPTILLRFENDAKLLEHLTVFFDQNFLDSLDEDSLSHLLRIFSHILPVAQSASVKLQRYKRNRLWDRATWAIVGKDLQSSEEDIYDWIKRLQTCLALFPKSAKTAMLSKIVTDSTSASLMETLTAQQRMEDLVAKFREIGYRQSKSLEPDLQLPLELSDPIKLSSRARIQSVGGKEYLVEFKKIPATMANDLTITEEMKEEIVKLVSVFSAVQPTEMYLLKTKFFFELSPHLRQPTVPLVFCTTFLVNTPIQNASLISFERQMLMATASSSILSINVLSWLGKSRLSQSFCDIRSRMGSQRRTYLQRILGPFQRRSSPWPKGSRIHRDQFSHRF